MTLPLQRLDREQTVQWLKRDRLPYFLQSDCYFEFRWEKVMHGQAVVEVS